MGYQGRYEMLMIMYLDFHEKARVGVKLWDNLYLFNVSQFQDKQKCSCWQLTIQTTAASNPDAQVNANAGYEFRRLMEGVPTGIYECNKFCKCNNTCLNRVAQNPIRIPLQVFKTDRRGWGIRTLCDIPRGENLVKFIYSEKATKFCEIWLLTVWTLIFERERA
mgnify:CR=1 FL=1